MYYPEGASGKHRLGLLVRFWILTAVKTKHLLYVYNLNLGNIVELTFVVFLRITSRSCSIVLPPLEQAAGDCGALPDF